MRHWWLLGRVWNKEVRDASWLSDAFDEPFGTAVKMLIKLCLESNSFWFAHYDGFRYYAPLKKNCAFLLCFTVFKLDSLYDLNSNIFDYHLDTRTCLRFTFWLWSCSFFFCLKAMVMFFELFLFGWSCFLCWGLHVIYKTLVSFSQNVVHLMPRRIKLALSIAH